MTSKNLLSSSARPLTPPFPVAVLLCVACASTSSPSVDEGVGATAAAAPEPSAAEVAVQAKLTELVRLLELPGATAAVVYRDGEEFVVAAGVADRARPDTPMPVDARMLAGSTGKALYAAAAIALQLDGAVDFDDRFAERVGDVPWLTEIPNGDQITLRDLLLHRSGVPEHVWDPQVVQTVAADAERTWAHEELVRLVAGRDPIGPPRRQFAYADANYILAMHAIERCTGRDLDRVAQEYVVEPLKLVNTVPSSGHDLGLVQGHVVLGEQLGAPARILDDDGRVAFNTSFEWAGGGWVSTSRDLARFARHFWSGDLFDAPYLGELTHAVETPQGPGDAYGVATIVRETPLGTARGHDGFFPGYLTSVAWFPEAGFAIAVQTNTDDVSLFGGRRLFHAVLLELARVAVR